MQKHLTPGKEELLRNGVVIPAMPLALNSSRKLDECRQRALIRYYLEAGVGGIAVGVHTTQFEIRKPEVGLYEPLLELAIEEIGRYEKNNHRSILKVGGVIGDTQQAVAETRLVAEKGYDIVLLSLAALKEASNYRLIEHSRTIASILPVMGFYLQPAVGGRNLDVDFWREFSGIENVVAIKIAPFNRYQSLDVIRGVIESGRSEKIALYTGNDDNILADLLTEFELWDGTKMVRKRIVGGLLGHWAVWTKRAVELLEKVHHAKTADDINELLTLGVKVTDCNAAFFDSANHFAGCIVGIHEVLKRQGLLEGTWTLNPEDQLSPGQKEEIQRVYTSYPELNDDEFISHNLVRWMGK